MLTNANRYFGNQLTNPRWQGDFVDVKYLARFPAKINAAKFVDAGGIQVVVGAAGAAANATSIPVNAIALSSLSFAPLIAATNVVIPAGSTLTFTNVVGAKKFAKTTADVKIGDTAVTVEALPTALVGGDTAAYNWWNGELVQSGTLVGRFFTNRALGLGFDPADFATPHDEIYLVAFDVQNARVDNDIALIRPDSGFTVKENYLPNYGTNAGQLNAGGTGSTGLTWLRAHHKCIQGTD